MNHYNPIYEQKSILETACVMHVFIDGVVVVNGKNDLVEEEGRRVISTMRVPVVIMQGIHPQAIAMSNSCGHWQYTSVAQARQRPAEVGPLVGSDAQTYRDADWERNMWWEDNSDGDPEKWQRNTGNGWNQNRLMPIAPDPVSGQQAFHDTVVRIRKLG